MHVFYQPDLSNDEILLNEEESKHCIRVLRMKKGDEVHLADGKGIHALATIIDDNPKRCRLEIRIRNLKSSPYSGRNYSLHIIVAPTKNSDRIEWFVEKAVEVGIDEISFVECENSERAKINIERCEKIAISAMKQSKQWWLPKINDLVKLDELLKHRTHTGSKFIAWCETDQSAQFNSKLVNHSSSLPISVLIGPEGDFTAKEVEQARQAGFVPVSLGDSILRTETAALYTCMAVKALLS